MKKTFNFLSEAYKAFRKKKYSDAYVILDKVTSHAYGDPYPHFLLAVTALHLNRFELIEREMKKIRAIPGEFPPALQLQGFLALKSSPGREAVISEYIDLLGKRSDDRRLHESLKKIQDAGDFPAFQKRALLSDFVDIPPPSKKKKYTQRRVSVNSFFIKRYLLVPIILAVFSFLVFFLFRFGFINNIISSLPFRVNEVSEKKIDEVDLTVISGSDYDIAKRINEKSVPEFYFSHTDLLRDFDESRKMIKTGRHNKALFLLNRMMNSNASFQVKEKADFLIKFVMGLEERTFEPVSFADITAKPYLYRGFSVKLSGKIANISKKNNRYFFNLLTDYHGNEIFSGMADIFFESEDIRITNGDMAEVDGIFSNLLGKRIYIVAKSIRKI